MRWAAVGAAAVSLLVGVPTAPAATTAFAPPAAATTRSDPNALVTPPRLDVAPPLHRRSGRQVMAIADRLGDVRGARAKHPGSYREAYEKGTDRWQVSYFTAGRQRKEIAQVLVADATGSVIEHWTGYKVAWTMARGYPGAFGRKVNEPWVWLPLLLLFVVPFVDPRRPFRWLHLDLLVLSAFSVSLARFNRAEIDASVPLVYPLLGYLLARMLAVGLRRRARPDHVGLLVPTAWLAIAVVFLLGFRIGLNVTSSNVIDVGYAGVIGADRLADGAKVYGRFPKDNEHGDTYGPVVYEAYVPFEQAMPWSGSWDDLPAAHGAAIAFDLLCVALLFLIGRMIRGPDLGIVLAYAWVAYPFTLFASATNTNDSLVAVLVLAAVLAAGRPALRGGAAALAGLTKFAPLALAPVLATHLAPGRPRGRSVALFAIGFVVAAALALVPFLVHENLATAYDRTIGFQATRGSPFSVWGLYGWTTAQHVAQAFAVALAIALALVPRRRDVAGLAALCAAVLLALQLGVTHWFYLYIVWFFPLVMIALLGREAGAEPPGAPAAS